MTASTDFATVIQTATIAAIQTMMATVADTVVVAAVVGTVITTLAVTAEPHPG
jgi:hypothetical protein